MAIARIDPEPEVPPVQWHVEAKATDLESVQAGQDEAYDFPRLSTDVDGKPVPNAIVVEHLNGIEPEPPEEGKQSARYRLRALPVEAFAEDSKIGQRLTAEKRLALVADAETAEPLPVDWREPEPI